MNKKLARGGAPSAVIAGGGTIKWRRMAAKPHARYTQYMFQSVIEGIVCVCVCVCVCVFTQIYVTTKLFTLK
jgi:hypothetical protein